MTVSLIVAMASNRVIGRDGNLPWRLPADMKRFRQVTTGHHVIMGRKTHESIGKPLPERTNIVLSRNTKYDAPGCRVAADLEGGLDLARRANETESFIIGGAGVYERALPNADRIYLTLVDAAVEGDVYFPSLEAGAWRETSREEHLADERHEYAFAFTMLERA